MTWATPERTRLILGPPGTGKTTLLVSIYGELLADGYAPEEIAAVSHTRASTAELCDRIAREYRLSERRMPWGRTLHSAALRLGVRRAGVLDDAHTQAWARQAGYDLTCRRDGDEPHTEDDRLYAVASIARQTMTAIQDLRWAAPATRRHAQRLADRLADYLREHDLIDYAGMLERVVGDGAVAPVRVALVDEAQDLSPLAVTAAATIFGGCDRLVVVGDDDQSLYGFAGARGEWIVDLSESAGHVEILAHSYRVPRRIHALAQAVIGDIDIGRRVAKAYAPRAEPGIVDHIRDIDAVADSIDPGTPTMILARTWSSLRPVARVLRAHGIPYRAPSRPSLSPWRDEYLGALRVAVAIGAAEPVTAVGLRSLLRQIPAGRLSPLPRGAKARAERHRGTLDADAVTSWGLGPLRDAIQSRGPASVLTRLPGAIREDLVAAARSGQLGTPSVALRSIHDSKGLEADHVILLSEWGGHAHDALHDRHAADDERRAAYVAVTRARHRLTIVGSDRWAYPWPRTPEAQ